MARGARYHTISIAAKAHPSECVDSGNKGGVTCLELEWWIGQTPEKVKTALANQSLKHREVLNLLSMDRLQSPKHPVIWKFFCVCTYVTFNGDKAHSF